MDERAHATHQAVGEPERRQPQPESPAGASPRPPRLASALARIDAPARAQVVLGVQRRQGNAFVQRVLSGAGAVAVQRQGAKPGGKDPNAAALDPARAKTLAAQVQGASDRAKARHDAVTAFIRTNLARVEATQGHVRSVARLMTQALEGFKRNAAAAGKEAALREDIKGTVVGLTIGLVVGAAAAPLVPAAGTIRRAAVVIGSDWVGELAEWGAGQHTKSPPPGQTAPGQAPLDFKLAAFEQLLSLAKELTAIALETTQPARIMHAAGPALLELGRQEGGKGTLAPAEVEKRVAALQKIDGAGSGIEAALAAAELRFLKLEADSKAALAKADINKMEQDLWILWLGAMDPVQRTEVLRLSAVRNRLQGLGLVGPDGRLGERFTGTFREGVEDYTIMMEAEREARNLSAVGKQGTVTRVWTPSRVVITVDGASFDAFSAGGAIPKGTTVLVTGTVSKQQPGGRRNFLIVQPVGP